MVDKKDVKVNKGIFDIHVIDVFLTNARSSAWVFDTGLVAHICNSKQELRNKRRLSKDEVTMHVGNGSKVDVITVGKLLLGVAGNFKKITVLRQDLSRRCIAMRGGEYVYVPW